MARFTSRGDSSHHYRIPKERDRRSRWREVPARSPISTDGTCSAVPRSLAKLGFAQRDRSRSFAKPEPNFSPAYFGIMRADSGGAGEFQVFARHHFISSCGCCRQAGGSATSRGAPTARPICRWCAFDADGPGKLPMAFSTPGEFDAIGASPDRSWHVLYPSGSTRHAQGCPCSSPRVTSGCGDALAPGLDPIAT